MMHGFVKLLEINPSLAIVPRLSQQSRLCVVAKTCTDEAAASSLTMRHMSSITA